MSVAVRTWGKWVASDLWLPALSDVLRVLLWDWASPMGASVGHRGQGCRVLGAAGLPGGVWQRPCFPAAMMKICRIPTWGCALWWPTQSAVRPRAAALAGRQACSCALVMLRVWRVTGMQRNKKAVWFLSVVHGTELPKPLGFPDRSAFCNFQWASSDHTWAYEWDEPWP